MQRFQQSRTDAALYKEAMAIREKQASSPSFAMYVLDGIKTTPEQLFHNLGHPFYGPVGKWTEFIDSLSAPAQQLPQQLSSTVIVATQNMQTLAQIPQVPVVQTSPPSSVIEELLRQQIKELQSKVAEQLQQLQEKEQQLQEKEKQLQEKDRQFQGQQQLHQQQLVTLQQQHLQSMGHCMTAQQQQAEKQAVQMQELQQMMGRLTSELLSPQGGGAKTGGADEKKASWFRSSSKGRSGR
jgi:DNA repair exonuclease SbcCD ATPase subunit